MKRIGKGIHHFSTFQMSTTKKCNGNGIRGVLCPVSVITVKNTYISCYSCMVFQSHQQTLMRSKCKMLHTVLEKFSSHGLDISTVNSEYKKIFKPSPSAEWNLKNWCSACSLSLSFPWHHLPTDHRHALTPWLFSPCCKCENSKTKKLVRIKKRKVTQKHIIRLGVRVRGAGWKIQLDATKVTKP